MKTTVITLVLLSLLGVLATGCQKEEPFVQQTVAEVGTNHQMQYTVDGVLQEATICGDAGRKAFIRDMLALARQGHKVSFRDTSSRTWCAPTKETHTFSTTNEEEAYLWADKMTDLGFEVTILYDEETGTFNCTAFR